MANERSRAGGGCRTLGRESIGERRVASRTDLPPHEVPTRPADTRASSPASLSSCAPCSSPLTSASYRLASTKCDSRITTFSSGPCLLSASSWLSMIPGLLNTAWLAATTRDRVPPILPDSRYAAYPGNVKLNTTRQPVKANGSCCALPPCIYNANVASLLTAFSSV